MPVSPPRDGDARRIAMGAAALGLAAFAFRYLTLSTIENDHFVLLARAQQVLAGDWPIRQFEDPGQPLFYLATAALASIFGHVLATNVILSILLQAVAASCTFVLARRASGSDLVGAAAAAVAIVSSPRLYNTTKVVVPVIAILLEWRYIDRPTIRRLIAMAVWTAVAFLLRHDYVVYVAASAAVSIAMVHRGEPRAAVREALLLAAVALLCVLPWLAYVQWNEGLAQYTSAAIRFVQSEGRRTVGARPGTFYLFVLVPVFGWFVSLRRMRNSTTRAALAPAHLMALSTLVLLINVVFLRDVLPARLPDVISPSVVLVAALMGELVPARAVRAGGAVLIAGVLVIAVVSLGVAGYRVPTPAAVIRQAERVGDRLARDAPEIQPSPRYPALVSYLSRCTAPRSRVFVEGFGPQIPFLSARLFAGGLPSWLPGYYETADDVARAERRLGREDVSAVVLLEGSPAFEESWPDLARWFRARGFGEHAVRGEDVMRIWLPQSHASAIDPATGLPCRQ